MRRVFLGVALIAAIAVVWQLQRSSAAQPARQPVSPQVAPAPITGAPSQAVHGPTAKNPAALPTEEPAAPKPPPAWVNRKVSATASSYMPPHQRTDPGVMGRVIGVRFRMFEDDLDAQEPSPEWTKAMQDRLEKAFELVPDSHPLSVDCRETTCKVEIIHEKDMRALDFNDELPASPVGKALQGDFVSFLERSDEDGQLKNVVFVERDGPGLKQKLADVLDWEED